MRDRQKVRIYVQVRRVESVDCGRAFWNSVEHKFCVLPGYIQVRKWELQANTWPERRLFLIFFLCSSHWLLNPISVWVLSLSSSQNLPVFSFSNLSSEFSVHLVWNIWRPWQSGAWASENSLRSLRFSCIFEKSGPWNKRSHWPCGQSAPRLYNSYNLCPCAKPAHVSVECWPGPEFKFSKTAWVEVRWSC